MSKSDILDSYIEQMPINKPINLFLFIKSKPNKNRILKNYGILYIILSCVPYILVPRDNPSKKIYNKNNGKLHNLLCPA